MVDDDCALLCNISTRVYCVGGLSIGSGKSVCMTWVNSNLVGHKLKLRCNFLGVLNNGIDLCSHLLPGCSVNS